MSKYRTTVRRPLAAAGIVAVAAITLAAGAGLGSSHAAPVTNSAATAGAPAVLPPLAQGFAPIVKRAESFEPGRCRRVAGRRRHSGSQPVVLKVSREGTTMFLAVQAQ